MNGEPEFRDSRSGAFKRIDDETPVHGGRFVGREGRAESGFDLTGNRRFGKDGERGFGYLRLFVSRLVIQSILSPLASRLGPAASARSHKTAQAAAD